MSEQGRPGADETFAFVAEQAPAMLWRGDTQGRCTYLNRAQREFWGVTDDGVASFTWSSTLLPEDSDKVFGPFSQGMAKQEPFTCEARYRRADGAIRILKTHAQPSFAADGVFTGMIGVNVDVTDERRAQAELSESEARLRTLADNLPFGMMYQIIRSPDGSRRFSFVSSRCLVLNGVEAEVAMADGSVLYDLILPEHREAFARAEAIAADSLQPFEAEVQMRRPNGDVRWFRMSAAPRPLADGGIVWDGVQVDIHEVKVAEERRHLLMKEMSHRIKNNLSTVLSIAAQTGRSAPTYKDFRDSFQARLMALAKSHDLLTRDQSDSADLRDILEGELRPYSAAAGASRSLTLTGEPVRLTGRAVIGLALVVHELATNAAKYGAYSVPSGAIDVAWRVNGDSSVTLSWRERGGPPAQAPNKSGFGSRLIESLLRSDLGGGFEATFTPDGFEADLVFSPAGPPGAR